MKYQTCHKNERIGYSYSGRFATFSPHKSDQVDSYYAVV